MVDTGMGHSERHIDKIKITEIIVISVLLACIVLLSLVFINLTQEVKHLEINNIGLPSDVANKLKDLLKP
jgi:hypothetical protein